MYVYLSVMFICCIILYATRNNENKIKPLAISFGMIWLMIALQDGWGGDHSSYVDSFEWFRGMTFDQLVVDEYHGELGYKILMSFMPNEHVGLMLGIAIWCFSMAFFFYHFIPQKWWFFAILFVFFDRAIMMGMVSSFFRMALANSCLIFAIYFIWKEKKWRSVALIILGAFFHKSVLFMLPLVFVGHKPIKLDAPKVLTLFIVFTIVFSLFPSAWINLVENFIMSVDSLEGYSYYFNDDAIQTKGITLLITFYWVYMLASKTNLPEMDGKEYLMMYYALIRIAFDLLPAVGMSTRIFYYMDIYFFAGMMCLLNRYPKKDVNIILIALSLLVMFWYTGFRVYAASDFYREHWATYNFIF